jgi:hypothetical protein
MGEQKYMINGRWIGGEEMRRLREMENHPASVEEVLETTNEAETEGEISFAEEIEAEEVKTTDEVKKKAGRPKKSK